MSMNLCLTQFSHVVLEVLFSHDLPDCEGQWYKCGKSQGNIHPPGI